MLTILAQQKGTGITLPGRRSNGELVLRISLGADASDGLQ